jgi:hypothetical protein
MRTLRPVRRASTIDPSTSSVRRIAGLAGSETSTSVQRAPRGP